MIVVDTSVVYALLDRNDAWHERVADWYRAVRPLSGGDGFRLLPTDA